MSRSLCLDMVSIYEGFVKELIHVNDDYSGDIKIHCIENCLFHVSVSSELHFLTNVATVDGKIQSISNKQFYYLPEKLNASCGRLYLEDLKQSYLTILETPKNTIPHIPTPLFYFMDYESVNGTVHSYDILFYLMYVYKKSGLTCPLLIPKSTNVYFQNAKAMFEKYYDVCFYEIEMNQVYSFSKIFFVRTYLNTFFIEVKSFINETLIDPILEAHKDVPFYDTVARVKMKPKEQVFTIQSVFEESDIFSSFCKEHSIFLMPEDLSEELKIYYINKAKYSIITWGSIFYIFIDYYRKSTEDLYVSVIFHKHMMSQRCFIQTFPQYHRQIMYLCDQSVAQVYNTLHFRGEIIEDLDSLDAFVQITSLKEFLPS